jgi:hypothetical protein
LTQEARIMACDCPEDDATVAAASAALDAALAGGGIAEATVDGATTKLYPLKDLIEAKKYADSRCAGRRPFFGIRVARGVPPGTT